MVGRTVQTGTNQRPGLPIALVIGGGGMGMSTARRLGQSHRVVLASQSAGKNADREAALREDGIDAVAVQFDVTDANSVAGLAKFVAGQGPLRTLAHVAGLSPSMGDWHRLFQVNLIGTALMERACLALAFPGTAAVFVSSSAGHLPLPEPPPGDVVEVLDDPLTPGFFDRLNKVIRDRRADPAAGLPAVEVGAQPDVPPPRGRLGRQGRADRLDVARADRHPDGGQGARGAEPDGEADLMGSCRSPARARWSRPPTRSSSSPRTGRPTSPAPTCWSTAGSWRRPGPPETLRCLRQEQT